MPSYSKPSLRSRGFTLVEIMVAVGIIGVLAAIAYPSYLSFVKSGHRGSAQNHMLQMATMQTQVLADSRSYANTTDINTLVPAPEAVAERYDFAVTPIPGAGTLATFVITGTPKGKQAPDVTLTIDSTGRKTPADKW